MDNKALTLEKGKVPPQSKELEETVIGAMMIDSSCVDLVQSFMKSEFFYFPDHQYIFKAIESLTDDNQPVDLVTVSERLKKLGTHKDVGDVKLITLTQKIASSAHVEQHARIVFEKYLKRKVIEVSTTAISRAYDDKVDVFDLIDVLGQSVDLIGDVIGGGQLSVSWSDAVKSIPQRVENLTNNQGQVTGLPTGLYALDKHFSGWQPQDFIVIGADSGMGKTAFVMCSMLAAAKSGKAVGMFSMEMSTIQLALRAMAVESDFHMNQLMRNGFEKDEYFVTLLNYVDKVKDYPIHIDDQPALTVPEMKRKARAMKRKYGIELLVIDFIQMFSGDKDIRINVGDAARECKNIAKELNIPVIALSQISREVKKSQYHLPKKYHLKEASAIEEAADVIGMLYRPEYYGYSFSGYPQLWEELGLMGEENAVLIVQKNRNGSLGNVGLKYVENKTRYENGFITTDSIGYSEAFESNNHFV